MKKTYIQPTASRYLLAEPQSVLAASTTPSAPQVDTTDETGIAPSEAESNGMLWGEDSWEDE